MLHEGIVGKNMKYIQNRYGISYSDIIHKDVQTLTRWIKTNHVQPASVQSNAQQIVELLSNEIPGFSKLETQDIIKYLCTE